MRTEAENTALAAYDTVAEAYAETFPDTRAELPVDLAMIDHFIALLPDGPRVLDAGCGTGRMLPYLAARGCQVQGVDLSSEMLRCARRDHGEFPTRVGTLLDLDEPDSTFDGVFSWYSTVHSPDEELRRIVAEFHRVLRPGGHVVLGFQSGSEVIAVGERYRERGLDVTLQRWQRRAGDMAEVLAECGFTVVAQMERAAVGMEREGQAVVVGRR